MIPELALNVITREEHNISRKQISDNALKVLYRLNGAGFDAFLVGGGVRDLLLGQKPKDFDIATNATPEQIKQLFRNCRLIGRRWISPKAGQTVRGSDPSFTHRMVLKCRKPRIRLGEWLMSTRNIR